MARKPKEYQGTFEVFDVIHRRLRNGNKLRLVLEQPYTREAARKLIDLVDREAEVSLVEQEPTLDQPELIPEEGGEEEKE